VFVLRQIKKGSRTAHRLKISIIGACSPGDPSLAPSPALKQILHNLIWRKVQPKKNASIFVPAATRRKQTRTF
jgi:hypothetical protein